MRVGRVKVKEEEEEGREQEGEDKKMIRWKKMGYRRF